MAAHQDLKNADEDTQRAAMREWFFQNFEDPAERTPYESSEGGYQWIWGGPYDAREELDGEFSDVVSEDVIEELAQELTRQCWEWGPTHLRSDYDDFYVDDIAQISEYHANFSNSLQNIKTLLETEVEERSAPMFYRMLFVNVISVLEIYLSDAFINLVIPDKLLMRKFVETTPEFKSEKISLSEVFSAYADIEKRAKSHLADIVWHNLERVKPMYKDTLDIEFKKDIGDLFRAIHKRHDIVHRNGKTKSGDAVLVTKSDIENLMTSVETFVLDLEGKINAQGPF